MLACFIQTQYSTNTKLTTLYASKIVNVAVVYCIQPRWTQHYGAESCTPHHSAWKTDKQEQLSEFNQHFAHIFDKSPRKMCAKTVYISDAFINKSKLMKDSMKRKLTNRDATSPRFVESKSSPSPACLESRSSFTGQDSSSSPVGFESESESKSRCLWLESESESQGVDISQL